MSQQRIEQVFTQRNVIVEGRGMLATLAVHLKPWSQICKASWCVAASSAQQQRFISEEQLNASQEHLQELFHKNLDNASRKRVSPFLTTRREALALYREVLRYSNLFVWRDSHGRPWRDVIRTSARKEFEDARIETDPEIINKLIITGRDAVQRSVEGFMKKRAAIIEDEAAAQEGPGSRPPQ